MELFIIIYLKIKFIIYIIGGIYATLKQFKPPIVKTVVQTMFYTGGRISEILNLKIADINLDTRIIHIIKGKGKQG
jgi:integrase